MSSNSINSEIGCKDYRVKSGDETATWKRFMKVSNEKSPTSDCDSFFTKSNLANHIEAVHEGKKPFECNIWDYKCAQKSTLKKKH